MGVCVQPVRESHASSVQGLPSSQPGGAPPTHCPPAQVSCVVQALASSQGALLAVCTHPVSGRQASSVQRLPSSQLRGVPTHRPPAQVSPVVHASRSSHGAVFGVCTHPVNGLQESAVHALPSSQPRGAPATPPPPQQASPVAQAPSSAG